MTRRLRLIDCLGAIESVMLFVVFAAKDKISHIFTEITHVYELLNKNFSYDRIEVWHKGRLSSVIF